MIKRIYPGIQGDYEITYCNLCQCDIISCLDPNCHGTLCNGGGCDKCHDDFINFSKSLKDIKNNGQAEIN